ncbi:MAG TPA: hypothetical protein VGE50_05490 [Gammaproteobacteria bacterium]
MRYGIIINLDYTSFPHEPVKRAYQEIQEALAAEGFLRDGRIFTLDTSATEAQRRARRAIDSVEARHAERGESLYPYIKEFFGFEMRHATNLLLPPSDEISVTELSDLAGIAGVETIELHGVD